MNPLISRIDHILAQRAEAEATSATRGPARVTANIFRPLLKPARYKAAFGGRGGSKSWFFAGLAVERCVATPGISIVCIREVQRVLAQSSKRLVETMIEQRDLGSEFEVLFDRIKTPGGGLMIFQGMQDHTAESIKSLEGYDIAWVDEAQALSARSLQLLRPTIRKPGSQLWFSWNPRRKSDAVDEFFRQKRPDDAVIIQANWRDNPWFPAVLEKERRQDLSLYPDRYDHVWEGGYARAFEGAYFAAGLQQARLHGRVGKVSVETTVPLRAFWDLGGAGAKADAMAIWIVQFVGREIRVLDYIEGEGQVLGYYVRELRKRGWGAALCVLPHDGATTNWSTGKRWSDHLSDAGFDTEIVKNQGMGAALIEIEAIRRILPRSAAPSDLMRRATIRRRSSFFAASSMRQQAAGDGLQRWAALGNAARPHRRREPPGNLSARSTQFSTAVAPSLPQRLQRIRGPKDGTVASSGRASMLTARSWPQCRRVTNKPRTPCLRMLPSVIGRIGSSSKTRQSPASERAVMPVQLAFN